MDFNVMNNLILMETYYIVMDHWTHTYILKKNSNIPLFTTNNDLA